MSPDMVFNVRLLICPGVSPLPYHQKRIPDCEHGLIQSESYKCPSINREYSESNEGDGHFLCIVQTHRRTDAQTHRRTDAQTHRRTDAQTHRRTDAQTHRHTDKRQLHSFRETLRSGVVGIGQTVGEWAHGQERQRVLCQPSGM
jgi:hypothetical protein